MAWQSIQIQSKYAAHKLLFQAETPVQEFVVSQDFYKASKIGRREITLNGNLYDIRSSEILGDSIRLVLYHDWHEQALYAILGVHFSRLNNGADPCSKPLAMWAAQWLGAAFILPDTLVIPAYFENRNRARFCWNFPVVSEAPSPPFTPPRNCF